MGVGGGELEGAVDDDGAVVGDPDAGGEGGAATEDICADGYDGGGEGYFRLTPFPERESSEQH